MNELKLHLYKCYQLLDTNFFDDFSDDFNKRIIFQKYGLFFFILFWTINW